MESLKATLTGVSPLLMHNGQLADPTNEFTKQLKAITSRKKKTDADHLEVRKVEWFGSLYIDPDGVIAMPANNILAGVIEGARKNKNGKQAEAGIYEVLPYFPLRYDGPKDPEKLYETKGFVDYRAVVVNQGRVMRSRPCFRRWELDVELMVDTDLINMPAARQALVVLGEQIGIGDFTPRHGRFTVMFH